ncbi:MAG: M20/M25/M40 family metallo-hydrolase, partial [Megasphaera sp.]|nr:M20/M25/M40 family metallo-hydrolase [Megasphaera sp.]
NQTLPKLPDLSANIGTIRTEADTVAIQYFPRASSDGRLREFVLSLPVFAELTGCTLDLATPEPAWAENPKSKLVPLFADVYREEAGRDPRIEAMHGGLETGYLFSMNQDLDIISVGPTTHDIHSADESVELDTVALLTRIVAKALGKLDK